MHLLEYTLAVVIVLGLLSLAGFFGWRQWQTLHRLPAQDDLPDEDRRYFRRQAWLRLVGCGLMVILAGLLVTWYLLGPNELAEQAHGQPATPAQQRVVTRSIACVTGVFAVLLALVGLATLDVLAIRRFGLRHYRRIQADRRAMIARQLARLQSERNGHG
ncbi:MAG TPA: hypothetical protein VFA18_15425 [Gemmataceae bacterium]|nr:hypothetical protein [Gemmataceae bacterium]